MKRIISVLIATALVMTLSLTAFAESRRIIDNASLLTPDEAEATERLLEEKRNEDGFDIVILIEEEVDDLESYADDYYDYNGYGIGEDRDGLLLLVTNEGCWLSTTGFGIDAVDPYLEELSADFHENVDISGYAYAFAQFIDSVSMCVNYERELIAGGFDEDYEYSEDEDSPVVEDFNFDEDFYFDEDNFLTGYRSPGAVLYSALRIIIVSLLIGLVIAFIYTSSLKRKLKSVGFRKDANDCIREGSMILTGKTDHFLYRTVSRSLKARNDNNNHTGGSGMSSSGGASTHVGSSGTTHGGGAF